MKLIKIFQKALKRQKLTAAEALFLINTPAQDLPEFLGYANQLREKFCKNEVSLCSIVNAKSGRCSEDCIFCAQSGKHQSKINNYPLLTEKELLKAAQTAQKNGVNCFSLVTSGKGVTNPRDFKIVKAVLKKMKGFTKSASLGILSKAQLIELKKVGLQKYHHNLEAAKSFFPKMCTTHTYAQRVQTVKNAQAAGLSVCCGGIFNLGETPAQRVELGLALRALAVDSVPINILNPIPGTKIYAEAKPISPQDIFRLIATFRFLMPDKTIGVMGGREYNLKDKQSEIFKAGANGILVGGYLTTVGNTVAQDKQMLKALGLKPKKIKGKPPRFRPC